MRIWPSAGPLLPGACQGRVVSCTGVRSPLCPPSSLASWLGAFDAQRRISERARAFRRLSRPRGAAPPALARSALIQAVRSVCL